MLLQLVSNVFALAGIIRFGIWQDMTTAMNVYVSATAGLYKGKFIGCVTRTAVEASMTNAWKASVKIVKEEAAAATLFGSPLCTAYKNGYLVVTF